MSQPSKPLPISVKKVVLDDFLDIPAGPGARKLARELGVSLRHIPGSARAGRITDEDVKEHVKKIIFSSPFSSHLQSMHKPMPNFADFGNVKNTSPSNLRKKIAENTTYAWQNIPHVHQCQHADITNILAIKKRVSRSF